MVDLSGRVLFSSIFGQDSWHIFLHNSIPASKDTIECSIIEYATIVSKNTSIMCQLRFLTPKMVFVPAPNVLACPLICPSPYWLDDVHVEVWYFLLRTIEVALMAQSETGIMVALSVVPHPSWVLTLIAERSSFSLDVINFQNKCFAQCIV